MTGMTTEALVPAAGEPVIAAGGGGEIVLPQVIVDAGPQATARFLEFFAGRIANARTRAAYGRAVGQFLRWCAARGLGLRDVSPLHVAAYIRTHPGSAPTVKQHLAAIRMLGDWLVVSQILPVNPAAAVRGPKHVVTKGATPVLSPAEARKLLETIDTGALAGLRDRALLSVMLYSFARVSAVLGMRRQDYFGQGSRGWLRLHEKGGKRHDVPAHHRAAAALDAYVEAGRPRGAEGGALPDRRPGGAPADEPGARSAARAGDDQAPGRGRGAAALDVLPHVPGDGDHGVPVERGDAGARAADRGARVSEDDEALRPDGGHGDGRRDRAHHDLNVDVPRGTTSPGARLGASREVHWAGRRPPCAPGSGAIGCPAGRRDRHRRNTEAPRLLAPEPERAKAESSRCERTTPSPSGRRRPRLPNAMPSAHRQPTPAPKCSPGDVLEVPDADLAGCMRIRASRCGGGGSVRWLAPAGSTGCAAGGLLRPPRRRVGDLVTDRAFLSVIPYKLSAG